MTICDAFLSGYDAMKFIAVLDGTTATAGQQAQALAHFLGQGLSRGPTGGPTGGLVGGSTSDLVGETVVFYADDADKQQLVDLAPTHEVRLIKSPPRWLAPMIESLAAIARDEAIPLFLFAGGTVGTECATRLAARTSGTVFTDALGAEVLAERLVGRKNVYANHLVGRFDLTVRPWCVSVDVSWRDGQEPARLDHRVATDTDASGALADGDVSPFEDLEFIPPPATASLADSRFLVVAGYGSGSRAGVERIAAAARRMGADFGVSRPVAMSAWAPMDRLIGVSGARVAPALFIVAGASGAAAFAWGIEKAAFIVAINPDDQAAIVKNADVAVLDDGVAVVEALAEFVVAQQSSSVQSRGGEDD
jgi:electron transfer flavoprotein alpha subunit